MWPRSTGEKRACVQRRFWEVGIVGWGGSMKTTNVHRVCGMCIYCWKLLSQTIIAMCWLDVNFRNLEEAEHTIGSSICRLDTILFPNGTDRLNEAGYQEELWVTVWHFWRHFARVQASLTHGQCPLWDLIDHLTRRGMWKFLRDSSVPVTTTDLSRPDQVPSLSPI